MGKGPCTASFRVKKRESHVPRTSDLFERDHGNGNVAENSIANFFLVKDGTILTPPEGNILVGVTRTAVFELAKQLGISLMERHLTMYDVAQADEFFITSSAIGAMPVREVDLFRPKAPIPGPVTRRLIEAFAEETRFVLSKHAS